MECSFISEVRKSTEERGSKRLVRINEETINFARESEVCFHIVPTTEC